MWRIIRESTKQLIDLDQLQTLEEGEGSETDAHGAACARTGVDSAAKGDRTGSNGATAAGQGTASGSKGNANPRVSEHLLALDALSTRPKFDHPTATPAQSGGVDARASLRQPRHALGSPLGGVTEKGAASAGAGAGAGSDDDVGRNTGAAGTGAGVVGAEVGVGAGAGGGGPQSTANDAGATPRRSTTEPVRESRASAAEALSSYYGITSTLASTGAALFRAGTDTAQYLASFSSPPGATPGGGGDAGEAAPVVIQRPQADYHRPPRLVLNSQNSALAGAFAMNRLQTLPDAQELADDGNVHVTAAELGLEMPSLAAAARGPSSVAQWVERGLEELGSLCMRCCRSSGRGGGGSTTDDVPLPLRCFPTPVAACLVHRVAVPLASTFGLSRGAALVLALGLVVMGALSLYALMHMMGGEVAEGVP